MCVREGIMKFTKPRGVLVLELGKKHFKDAKNCIILQKITSSSQGLMVVGPKETKKMR